MRIRNHIIFFMIFMLLTTLRAMGQQASSDTLKSTELQEVVVKKKRNKYTKKNNPAVDLLQRIRKEAPQHDPRDADRYSYDKYEKLIISLNDFHKEKAGWLSRQLHPIEDYIDTANITGKPVLNVSVRERSSFKEYDKSAGRPREIITGQRNAGIDEGFDQENIQIMLDDVFREVDIFKDDITILQNRFVSPLSRIGADYYKYFLGDTTLVDGRRCVELIFVPHNPESFSFNGSLYVDINDSTLFIPRVRMRIPKALNINFVKNIFVEQDFQQDSIGNRNKTADRMSVEMQLMPGVQGFYISRDIWFDDFSYLPSDTEINLKKARQLDPGRWQLAESVKRDENFWQEVRPGKISESEKSVGNLASRLDRIPVFYWIRRGINLLVTGYIPTGNPSKVDIGPVNTMLSFNSVEGTRFRLGGMTTAALNPHLFARGYGAYGIKDHRWKYGGELEWSFSPKKKHSREFPMNSLRLEHQYDLDMIGQHYLFTNADNIFLSLKRLNADLMTYRRLSKFSWNFETVSGWSLQAGYKLERQEATPWVTFVDGAGVSHPYYDLGTFFVDIQFAPGAKFVQTASNRFPVNMDNWTVRLRHEFGPRRMMGSDFTVNKTDLSVAKRFWFSSFGYVDALVKGSWVWSAVPYPSLPWANANLSYTIQPESFALLNPMEFVVDRSTEWFLTYWMNGLLFNRIPWLKELKLREVITFSGLFGRLSSRNNPQDNQALYRFPQNGWIRPMTGKPYMEIGVGIDNIFSVLRVDYLWRLTHRHEVDAPNQGLRVSLHFSF